MGVVIRAATDSERAEAAKQWTRTFTPSAQLVTIGSQARTLTPSLWSRAHRLLVQSLLDEARLDVLVLDDVPTEPLGWVCYVPDEVVHYVYVLDKARRRGIGRRLLTHAGGTRHTHHTASGAFLLGEHREEVRP